MARPQTRSDQAILEATRTVLMERGPSASISAIAKKARLSGPAILGRFGSRAALVQAALAPPPLAPVLAALYLEPSTDDFQAQLERLLLVMGAWYQQALPCQVLLRLSPPSQRPLPANARAHQPRIQPTLTIWLAKAQARELVVRGDPQALSATILHALRGHATQAMLLGGRNAAALATVVQQLASLTLRPPSPFDYDAPARR